MEYNEEYRTTIVVREKEYVPGDVIREVTTTHPRTLRVVVTDGLPAGTQCYAYISGDGWCPLHAWRGGDTDTWGRRVKGTEDL